jgi:hypothetical protein
LFRVYCGNNTRQQKMSGELYLMRTKYYISACLGELRM